MSNIIKVAVLNGRPIPQPVAASHEVLRQAEIEVIRFQSSSNIAQSRNELFDYVERHHREDNDFTWIFLDDDVSITPFDAGHLASVAEAKNTVAIGALHARGPSRRPEMIYRDPAGVIVMASAGCWAIRDSELQTALRQAVRTSKGIPILCEFVYVETGASNYEHLSDDGSLFSFLQEMAGLRLQLAKEARPIHWFVSGWQAVPINGTDDYESRCVQICPAVY